MNVKKITFAILIATSFCVSFFLFAPVFSSALNSDHAVHIMMSQRMQFPEDLYYWGQSRLGSFLPLLSWFLYSLLPIKTITAISLVQFLLLGAAYLFLQNFLKSWFSKFLLSLVLFIPFPLMIVQVYVGHPYAGQFFLFALLLYLHKNILCSPLVSFSKKALTWFLSGLLFCVSIWVSDISAVFVLLLASLSGLAMFHSKSDRNGVKLELNVKWRDLIFYPVSFLVFVLSTYFIITFAKTSTYQQPGYDEFIPLSQLLQEFDGLWIRFRNSFEFLSDDKLISYYNLSLFIVFLVIFIYSTIRLFKGKSVSNFYPILFFLTSLFTTILVVLSKWVFLSKYDMHYFICSYFFFSLFIISSLDKFPSRLRLSLQVLFLSGILTFSISTYKEQKIYLPQWQQHLSLKKIQQFKSFEHSGIIADYWFSYIFCIDSDMDIVATPHDKNYVRNFKITESVLKRDKIFVIKNFWLQSFPDTLEQFGLKLTKNGDPQKIGEVEFCQYKHLKINTIYGPAQLKSNTGSIELTSDSGNVLASDINRIQKQEYFLYGPFIRLPKGKFSANFYFRLKNKPKETATITFDIVENYGSKIFGSKTFHLPDYRIDTTMQIQRFDFECPTTSGVIEFRINIDGKSDLLFYKVHLVEN